MDVKGNEGIPLAKNPAKYPIDLKSKKLRFYKKIRLAIYENIMIKSLAIHRFHGIIHT